MGDAGRALRPHAADGPEPASPPARHGERTCRPATRQPPRRVSTPAGAESRRAGRGRTPGDAPLLSSQSEKLRRAACPYRLDVAGRAHRIFRFCQQGDCCPWKQKTKNPRPFSKACTSTARLRTLSKSSPSASRNGGLWPYIPCPARRPKAATSSHGPVEESWNGRDRARSTIGGRSP